MILGVDHVALSCADVTSGADVLAAAGYHIKFMQHDVPNDPSKQSILRSYDPLHAIAYAQIDAGVALELTQHSHPLQPDVSPYQVLFNGLPPDAVPLAESAEEVCALPPAWSSIWQRAGVCQRPAAVRWQPFAAQCWYDAQNMTPGTCSVRAVMLPAHDIARAETFWKTALGCRVVERGVADDGTAWVCVAFHSPVPSWRLQVVLVASDKEAPLPCADDAGFPCLALITNRLHSDMEQAFGAGATQGSAEFHIEVGGKGLNIIILRGPTGELVELIEICR